MWFFVYLLGLSCFAYLAVSSPRILMLNERASRRAGAPQNSATLLYPDFLAHAFCARGKKFVEPLRSPRLFFLLVKYVTFSF